MSTATQTFSIREIIEANEEGRVSLRPNASCTHDTGEDMYDSYGWHTSSDIFGDCELQTVEYGWLDPGEDKYILKTAAAGHPLERTEYTSREDLLTAVRTFWPDASLEAGADYVYDVDENEVAEIEYQPADPVERTVLALGWPDSSESDRKIKSERRDMAKLLVRMARRVREDMDAIESLLDVAVAAYERGDLDGVIEALHAASSTESDHGDDPATSELIHELLQIKEDEEVPSVAAPR